uniref:interferon a3-like n=1 Tax=Monopterus albus TaxID=43700 RepID=UPI0009B42AC6|nr:interferon a3-like [Monopterus albus]
MVICTGLVLILCTVLTPALCRDCLSHYGHYSNISLTLIHNMGGPMTQEDGPVPFPEKLYRHIRKAEVETQLIFIRDSLMEIASLYRHGNWSSVTWDAIKTTGFLSSIHRQIDELNKCVLTKKSAGSKVSNYYRRLHRFTLDSTVSTRTVEVLLYRHGNWSSVTWDAIKTTGFLSSIHRQIDELNKCVLTKKSAGSKVSNYYRRLHRFTLDSTGGSTACWEWLRKQTQLHLDQLDLLVNSLRAAARRRSAPTPHQH